MAPMSLPPGFRFHPTDEELVAYYLDRKITGRSIELEIIPEIDLYKCEPWDLPDKSLLPSKDMEWYFYSRRDKKYPNGSRTNRATRVGYWKATGKDRPVTSQKRPVGMKKTLVYYKGRAPHGIRTNWVMHEYRLLLDHDNSPSLDINASSSNTLKESYALCRVFKKTMPPVGKLGAKEENTTAPSDIDVTSGTGSGRRCNGIPSESELESEEEINVGGADTTSCSDVISTDHQGTHYSANIHQVVGLIGTSANNNNNNNMTPATTSPLLSDEALSSGATITSFGLQHHVFNQMYYSCSWIGSDNNYDDDQYPSLELDDFPQIAADPHDLDAFFAMQQYP